MHSRTGVAGAREQRLFQPHPIDATGMQRRRVIQPAGGAAAGGLDDHRRDRPNESVELRGAQPERRQPAAGEG